MLVGKRRARGARQKRGHRDRRVLHQIAAYAPAIREHVDAERGKFIRGANAASQQQRGRVDRP